MSLTAGFLIGFSIYVAALCSVENVCYRTDSEGNKKFDFTVIFTEGLIGPIRTTYHCIREKHWGGALRSFFSPYNPWFVIPTTMGMVYLVSSTTSAPQSGAEKEPTIEMVNHNFSSKERLKQFKRYFKNKK